MVNVGKYHVHSYRIFFGTIQQHVISSRFYTRPLCFKWIIIDLTPRKTEAEPEMPKTFRYFVPMIKVMPFSWWVGYDESVIWIYPPWNQQQKPRKMDDWETILLLFLGFGVFSEGFWLINHHFRVIYQDALQSDWWWRKQIEIHVRLSGRLEAWEPIVNQRTYAENVGNFVGY